MKFQALFWIAMAVALLPSLSNANDAYKPDPYGGDDTPKAPASADPYSCAKNGEVTRLGYMDNNFDAMVPGQTKLPPWNQGKMESCYAYSAAASLNAWRFTHGMGNGDEISPYLMTKDSTLDDPDSILAGSDTDTALKVILDHPAAPVCSHDRIQRILDDKLHEYEKKINDASTRFLKHRAAIDAIQDNADPTLREFRDRFRRARVGEMLTTSTPSTFCADCVNIADGNTIYYSSLWANSFDNIMDFLKALSDHEKAGDLTTDRCLKTSDSVDLFQSNDNFKWAISWNDEAGLTFDYPTIARACREQKAANVCQMIVTDLKECMEWEPPKTRSSRVKNWIANECADKDKVVPFPPGSKVPKLQHFTVAQPESVIMDKIRGSLANRQPVTLQFDANLILADERKSYLIPIGKSGIISTGTHAAEIIGQRCVNGKSQLLLRSSWGTNCSWAKPGLDCETNTGDIWVDSATLIKDARATNVGIPFEIDFLQ